MFLVRRSPLLDVLIVVFVRLPQALALGARDVVWSLAHHRRRVTVAAANGQLYRGHVHTRDGTAVRFEVPEAFATSRWRSWGMDGWGAWRPLADEGITWCYGWSGDRVAALEVARALRSS